MKFFLLNDLSRRSEAFFSSRAGMAAEYFLLAVSGAFYSLIFPKNEWAFLAWFGMLPLFWLLRGVSAKQALSRGFVWGYFWSLCSFFWFREIFFLIPFAMAAVLGIFPALWAAGHVFLEKNTAYSPQERLAGFEACKKSIPFPGIWRGTLFLGGSSSLWVLTEYCRSWFATGLPWNYLSLSQWRNTLLIQICEFTGSYGVSFLVFMINLSIYIFLLRLPVILSRRKYERNYSVLFAFALLGAAFLWGSFLYRRANRPQEKHFPFAAGVTQSNLSQRRFGGASLTEEAIRTMADLSETVLKSNPEIDVVIWPETAVPCSYVVQGENPDLFREEVGKLLEKYRVPFLIGSVDFLFPEKNPADYKVFNSALYLTTPGGYVEDRYSKVHRVPFGEFVPFGEEFPFLVKMVGMGRNLTSGNLLRPLSLGKGAMAGISICFESVFPEISRGHVRNGANMLVVITNDAWYPTSNEPEQHFAHAVFRAVENRLPLIRCGNGGFSALISPRGEIVDAVLYGRVSEGKNVFDISLKGSGAKKMLLRVPEKPALTFYAKYADLFVAFCGIFAILAFLTAFSEWRFFRLAQADDKFLSQKKA